MKKKTLKKIGISIEVILWVWIIIWAACFGIMFKGMHDGTIKRSDELGWYDTTVCYTNLTDGTSEYTYTDLGLFEIVDRVIN